MGLLQALIVAFAAVALSACSSMPAAACRAGEQLEVHDMLFFGSDTPDGLVTSEQWAEFLATVVTPRFPEGFSVLESSGQWRGASGKIVREPGHVLQLLHPEDPASEKSVVEIAAAYKARFKQESVLRVRSSACVTF